MGRIYKEIEINNKKVSVKVDTGSDFDLSLKKETIEKLNLKKHPTAYAEMETEELGKIKSPVWMSDINVRGCTMPAFIVEASGENLLGHPILQELGVNIDEKNHNININCPQNRISEKRGRIIITGSITNGRLGKIVQ